MDAKKVIVYDTTLRDGTQCEGVSMSAAAKLRMAEKMDSFGIDIIEGGWPGSNPRDMAFFEQIKNVKKRFKDRTHRKNLLCCLKWVEWGNAAGSCLRVRNLTSLIEQRSL